jgi:ankyrin repeat protein
MEFSKHFSPIDPRHADFSRLKRHAKDLKDAFDSGDRGARELVARHLAQHAADERLKLAYAQFVIARSHGFKSWARLKAFVEARQLDAGQLRDALLALVFESNEFALAAVYDRRAELDTSDVYVAAAMADTAALARLVAASPELVNARGGPHDCTPLVYLCHSQLGKDAPGFRDRQLEGARLLLAHGADANAATPKDEHGHVRSSLYGTVRSPGHPELCELLLEQGARASDGESLYHASELRDLRCLKLLLEHGPDDQDREYCVQRMLDHDNAAGLRLYLEHGTNPNHLCAALFRERSIECLRTLVEFGADVNEVCEEDWLRKRVAGLTPIQIAERYGDDAAVELLLGSGARDHRGPRDRLIGACARGDRASAESLLAAAPDLVASLTPNDHSFLSAFARAGRREAVAMMLDAGFDIEAKADDMICSGFVYAAMNGDVAMLRLFMERGCDLNAAHKHGGNALGSALYCAVHFRAPGGDYAAAVELLLAAGLKAREDHLSFVLDHGQEDLAEVLIAHGGALPDDAPEPQA